MDPFIDPEEKYILFHRNVPGREGLHVSERRQNKAWAKARLIPGTKNAICPFVTSDRKFLFFSNNWKLKMPVTCQSYRETIKILRSAGNGFNDIYWVSADILGLDKIKK